MPEKIMEHFEEPDEQSAAESLQTAESMSDEEQERFMSTVTDPELSVYVLTSSIDTGRVLTSEQKEKLLRQIESDSSQAHCLYLNLSEARNTDVPLHGIEIEWLDLLEAQLLQTEDPVIAADMLEYATTATDADRERLRRVTDSN